ncbi:MAG: type II toxin-antitoxin system RelE/ParE family toxin [Candidatus Levybacteria bacterium]|nr:type II toxin-antitoxin system RelE/ParE family toxin [Candidatus Levybacteria bacterium]
MLSTWKVIYFTTSTGENPVRNFIDNLNPKQQAKILRIFMYIQEYGLQSIIPHVKKISGTPLWEIRILGKDNIRVLYVIHIQQEVLVLHGFIKKKQKTPKKEFGIALKRYEEWKMMIDK